MQIIRKIPLWILLCLFGLSHATETALTAALPAISYSFNIAGSKAQICSTIYFLGFASGILTLGRISDIYGRRPVILAGMILYLIATLLSIFAFNIKILIFLRFIQAFGASVGSVIGQAMARDSYQGKELSYIYASLSMALALVPSLGSTLGGYIVEFAGWRYIFVCLACISSLLLILYFKLLPETNRYIDASSQASYFTITKVIFYDKAVLLYAFIIGSFNGMCFGFYMEAPFILINQLGIAPSTYGKFAFLLSAANAFGSWLTRYLVRIYIETKKIMLYGLVLSFIGCIIFIISINYIQLKLYNQYFNVIIIFVPMMLHMIGHSFFVPLALRYALEDYSKVTGTAGSIFGSLYYFIVAVISFTISRLHSDLHINNFAVIFLILSTSCCYAFYIIRRNEMK